MKLLFECGANLEAINNKGYTALHRACQKSHFSVVKFLIENGANIEAKTNLNYTALHMAIQSGDIAIVTLLLSKNPDLGKYRMCKQ